MKKTPCILSSMLVGTSLCFGQTWLKIDSVFNPSGVAVQNFSSPEFADLDGDGSLDLLLGNGSSTRVDFFRSLGAGLPPRFQRDTTLLASIYAGGSVGTNADYPMAIDLDNDRDLDLVIGGYNGLLYYRNIGDSLTPLWNRVDSLFAQLNTLIGTDAKPAFADLDGDGDYDLLVGIGESLFGGPPAGVTFGFRNTGTHTAPAFTYDSTLVFGIPDVGLNSFPALNDIDNDGDFDLLIGRDLASLVHFRNIGSRTNPVWSGNSTTFSGVEATTYWKQPTLRDVDHDGDCDLVYGTSDGTLKYYENTGSPASPQFQFRSSYFAVIRTDGNGATTSLADFDNDGDFDLISGDWLGRIQYFRNDGTAQGPRFTKTTAPFTGIDVGSYSAPKFIDIDGDNDKDIVAGALDGMLYCYINNGASFTQNTTLFPGIDVGFFSAPAFADLDGDGDPDLLVGAEDAAAIRAFRNMDAGGFIADGTLMTGVSSVRNGHPTFVDLDRDGDFDLVIGGGSGQILFYRNDGTPGAPMWNRDDAVLGGVRVRQNASPAFADLDGDLKPDAVVAEYNGNFSFYKNQIPTSAGEMHKLPESLALHQNFPNPFNPVTTISYEIPSSMFVSVKVYDLLGRELRELVGRVEPPGRKSILFDAQNLASGVYTFQLVTHNGIFSRRMVLVR